MAWRILHVTKPCNLSVKSNQLVYQTSEDKLTVPLEDISVIILEDMQVSLSNYLLSSLAEYNIILFTCNKSHIPSGAFFSYFNHSRYLEVSLSQIASSEPFKKRLWQSIIKQKIINQAIVLKRLDKPNFNILNELSQKVQSGDAKNNEATAASIYWKSLFNNFNRSDDADIRNVYLNYGYSILRGLIARNLVGAGLLTIFGVHHRNMLNQFNLADDLMEPFRPFVDYEVSTMDIEEVLTPKAKHNLISTIINDCVINEEQMSILKAAEVSAFSLSKSIKQNEQKYLKLPKFVGF